MKIFVAGGTGVVGSRAVPALVAQGHEVTVLVRSPEKTAEVRATGATPADASLFDYEKLKAAVAGHDVVVNLATSIPPFSKASRAGAWKLNDRIRREGSKNLVDAAIATGASRYVQESVAFLYTDGGGTWLHESAPTRANSITGSALDAEKEARRFGSAGGTSVILRFGSFYGPDSEHTLDALRFARRGFGTTPGRREGYIASISTDDAAAAVVAAATEAPAGTYNVVDDEPVTREEYDQVLARAVGRQKLRPMPTFVVRLMGDKLDHVVRSQRVSNKALRDATSWRPRYPSVREGIPAIAEQAGISPAKGGGHPAASKVALLYLLLSAAYVGAWAQFWPGSFYAEFPGGKGWVAADGAFNEHLIRDLGGLNLALVAVTAAALFGASRALRLGVGLGWLAYGAPHLVYHLSHNDALPAGDRLLNGASLTLSVVAALVVVAAASMRPRHARTAAQATRRPTQTVPQAQQLVA